MHIFGAVIEYLFIMRGKLERQRQIRKIIAEQKVANQEELSALLAQHGFDVAQATLSRDIRELRITKVHDDVGYYYRLPAPGSASSVPRHGTDILVDSIERLEFSGQLAVISTLPGHANMIAAIIDAQRPKQVLGSLAGDDTVLLVLREGSTHAEVTGALDALLRGITNKRIN